MIFNSSEFAGFFAAVFGICLVLPHKWQNRMLLAASYYFYGSWDWRFLVLIWTTTLLDFFCGLRISQTTDPSTRKRYLLSSLCGNLTILGFFKYYNFFAGSLHDLLGLWGLSFNPFMLNVILPVGISFYTFKSMSYTVDIYRNQFHATRNLEDYALFVGFFPQLLAGPIERAKDLLTQIAKPRSMSLEQVYEGAFLIFWGLFQKVFIADNLAKIVDPVFSAQPPYGSGAMVLIAAYAFTFEIYCDFAGYSNMAKGLGKCLGFDIMTNFDLPYFSVNPREFWRRWHISLSQWLRDYLYVSMGGNRKGIVKLYRNLFLTMVLGGLWHGAAWTFVLWGAYHGALLVIHRLVEPFMKGKIQIKKPFFINAWWLIRVMVCFHLVGFGWVIFRAESLGQVLAMVESIWSGGVGSDPEALLAVKKLLFGVWPLVLVQIYQYRKHDLLAVYHASVAVRAVFYVVCIYLMAVCGAESGKDFIYFQF
jgi:D-alanyl-lipoteichoic acid acyltransferase DltB (MBOAT superfamily)